MNAYITLFKSMLEISLFASIMIAAVFAIKTIFRNKISIKTVTLLWLLVIIRLCLPVMVQSPFTIGSLLPDTPEVKQAAEPGAEDAPPSNWEGVMEPAYEPEGMTPPADMAGASGAAGEKPEGISFFKNIVSALSSADLWGAVSVAWLAGAVIVFFVSVEKSIAFSLYAKKSSREINDKKFLISFDILKIKCGIKRNVKISACKLINMPVVYGIIKPRILLPESMAGKLKKEHMDSIILHELCHIKSGDILKNYVFLLGKALHWFNPLVWLTEKAIREDTELLCDQKVLAIIGDRHKGLYSQSLLEATRFVIERKTPVLTISLCENKSNLKERIIQMLKPQKKLRSAGIVSALTAILMIIGCFTTACQSAPDATVEFTTPPNVPAAEPGETQPPEENPPGSEPEADFTQYQAPETFAKTYEKDSLLITVDAQVVVPEVEKIYSVAFEHREFSQEMVDNFLSYFIGDAPVYIRNESDTKASTLEKEIETWKQAKYNAENNWEEVKDRDPYQDNGGQQGAIDYIQGVIDRLEQQLENAPEEYGYTLGSRLIAPPGDDGGKDIPPDATEEEIAASKAEDERVARENASIRELIAYAKMDESYIDDKMAYIYIHGRPGRTSTLSFDNANEANEAWITVSREEMDELSKTINLPLDDAVIMAQQVFEEMGFGSMYLNNYNFNALVKNGQLSPCYWLLFYRDIYGMPVLPLSNGIRNINMSEPKITEDKIIVTGEQPTPTLLEAALSGVANDSVSMVVDEEGVTRVSWDAALQQTGIIGEYTDILSFEQVISIFEDNILELCSSQNDLEIVINKISLSMLPVQSEGSDEIIAIPVWDFRGYAYDPNDTEEKQRVSTYNTDRTSYLTINALDGSLVNR